MIPGQGIRILHAKWCGQRTKKPRKCLLTHIQCISNVFYVTDKLNTWELKTVNTYTVGQRSGCHSWVILRSPVKTAVKLLTRTTVIYRIYFQARPGGCWQTEFLSIFLAAFDLEALVLCHMGFFSELVHMKLASPRAGDLTERERERNQQSFITKSAIFYN